ncbi:MAG: DMT family transporter [Planctomycetaceae bacterium]|nr:DMT family transporter [Planctomycetaceae bacterium]
MATSQATDPSSEADRRTRERMIGLLCGLVAAIGYTLANMALRQSARPGDFDWSIWVTAHKAVPATLLTWGLVCRNLLKRETALPSPRVMVPLTIAGLIMQFAGNLSFQYALGLIGLAMSVPITFALLLLSGAITSRAMLGEPITNRSALALTTLILAVAMLSVGAGDASRSVLQEATLTEISLGVFMAMLAGAGYGVSGVVIRRYVRELPISATLVVFSTVGVVAIGALAVWRVPWEVLASTTLEETLVMQLAGIFNAVAFYCIGVSFRYLNVNQVNMINTTQIAMATLVGVIWFAEPLTPWLSLGVLLTIAGLYLMDRH